MAAIRTGSLTKRFERPSWVPGRDGETITAVRDLDLVVEDGEVFGFLGPNGAGKSTTINVLLDYVRPTAGRAEVLGMDAQAETAAIHDRIGVLPETPGFYERLTARKHLLVATRTKGADDDPAAVLQRVGLADDADRQVGEFSTGMCQRLALAIALVGDPDLLILDEPTAGLDPNGVRRLRGIVDEEVDRGATVFFSSHVLEQVEAVCDRVGILRDGELVALDTIEGLRADLDAGDELTVTVDELPDDATAAVGALDGVAEVTADGRRVVAACTRGTAKVAVLDVLRDHGATIADFDVGSADLESLFATYAGDGRGATGEDADGGGDGGEGADGGGDGSGDADAESADADPDRRTVGEVDG